MAQGERRAKDLLRKAIQARYGLRPPVLESLDIDFKGRARMKIGPMMTWVPIEVRGRFCFPDAVRWDFTIKAAGVHLDSGVEAYDGQVYRSRRGQSLALPVANEQAVHSMQQRLWAIAAMLLTPLGEHFVHLESQNDHQLRARNARLNGAVNLDLRGDQSLDSIEAACQNPDTGRVQLFRIQLAGELQVYNDLILPARIMGFWDSEACFELEPVRVDMNPTIMQNTFALDD
jgi:hypothetical protein